MVRIEAKLIHGSTYFAGEEVECKLRFTNPPKPDGVLRLSSDIETLAWTTAQIHCQCTISASGAVLQGADAIPPAEGAPATELGLGTTYFNPTRGERGVTVMMSQPRILFCNIKLSPGESTEYVYREKIPLAGLPPSFRGCFVKYAYKLTIGTQRPDCPISEIKIPFRVLTVEGLKELSAYMDKELELAPSNPFLLCEEGGKKDKPEHTIREIALQLLSEQGARRRNNCYNISNLRGKISRVHLTKSSYKIGEDLLCTFDFTPSTVQCLQVTLTLQSVEELAMAHKKEGDRSVNVSSHGYHQEFCLHTSKAHIALPIPLHITPTFKSDHVSLTWRVHIEFITLITSIPDQITPSNRNHACLWRGSTDLETESMHLDLPITILSNNPLQCGLLHSIKCDVSIDVD